MNQLQLIALMSPSVGTFVLVILAWMQSNARLGDLKEDLGRRIGNLEIDLGRRISDLDKNMNHRFDAVNRQFDNIDHQFDTVNSRLNRIEEDQKHFYAITGKLDGRIDEIAKR